MLKKLTVPIFIVLAIGIILAVLGKWNWLVWGVLLLCPLMHLFGHNHSGNHNHNHGQDQGSKHHH
ncbi:DUF2933 domain-containing protein [Bacillota bacterium Lsc_1132]